ncbi:MAG: DUF1015 domain-containing protein [Oligoflexia bacterium]|nr:DUF1015 domain-containing protein [Oligoflexia bacterium]MBF0364057.1 DUF1015 domain-containing protein [Oligoflexia bacterium]
MVMVRAFKGVRPKKELAESVASFPYDVITSKEAREIAKGNPHSFLHVGKSEIDLPEEIDLYDDRVYAKAKENFEKMIREKTLIQDPAPYLYIYKQKMGDHEQYGLVACVSAEEYKRDLIKKHELTRKAKEDDRTKHVLVLNANAGPVFLTYRDREKIDSIVCKFVKENAPEADFVKEDGIGHTVWVIRDQNLIEELSGEFAKVDALYVADGHHRSAAAARAWEERLKQDSSPSIDKEYNYFLAVIFPSKQLKIMDYNRLVFTLNGQSKEEFLKRVKEKFDIIAENSGPSPKNMKEFGMFLDGKWYQIRAKAGSFPAHDPVEGLDVSILQNNLLSPILGIGDPRTDNNIDFIGGIRGAKELEKRVNSGEGKVAFKLHPTSIEQLIDVADAGKMMPPKSTWFEPKLRSGLIVHLLD